MKKLNLLILVSLAFLFISAGDEECYDGYLPIKPTGLMGHANVFVFYNFNSSESNVFMPSVGLNKSYMNNGANDKISLLYKSDTSQNIQGSDKIDGVNLTSDKGPDRFVTVSNGIYLQTGIVDYMTEYNSIWNIKDTILHFPNKDLLDGKSLYVGNFDSDGADEFAMIYEELNQEYLAIFKMNADGIPVVKDSVLLDTDKTPIACTVDDFNSDGENELVMLYRSSGNVMHAQVITVSEDLQIGKNSSHLLLETGFNENIIQSSISSGDYNKDGKAELAIAISKISSCNAGNSNDCENVFVYPFTINTDLGGFNLNPAKVIKYFFQDADGDYNGPAELISYDLTNNGRDELILGSQNIIVHAFDDNLDLEQSKIVGTTGINSEKLSRIMAIADVNGGESEELIYLDYKFQPEASDRFSINYLSMNEQFNIDFSESIDLSQQLDGSSNEQYITFIPGFFAGEYFRIDSCPKYTVREEISEVMVVLNTPPVHFDILDGDTYDISDVFNDGGSSEEFTIEYTTTSTKGSTNFVSSRTSGDWGFQPSFNFDLVASFKDIIGVTASFGLDDEEEKEEFESTSKTHEFVVTESVSQNSFDNRLLTQILNYETWKYNVVDEESNIIGNIHAVRQKDPITDFQWIESRNVITKGIVLKHEPGNLMSYMEINEKANNNKDVKTFIGQGRAAFTVGIGGNYSHNLKWADYFNEENTTRENIVESSPEFGLSIFSSSLGVSDGSQGKLEKISTRTVTVGEEMGIKINMNRVSNTSYSYSVTPYYYWSVDGALVVDYSIGFDQTSDFWQSKYGQNPDPAFIMPFRMDKYKGWQRIDTSIYNLSSSIFYYPGLPAAGDTIDIIAQINNYSLKVLNSGTEVAFYLNDPLNESNRIISTEGNNVAILEDELEGRNFGYAKMRWAVPKGIDVGKTRIFAEIDPNNEIGEIHENNNIAWSPLDKSAWEPDVSTVNESSFTNNISSIKQAIIVYPNPSEEFIQIIVPSNMDDNVRVEIFDLSGKIMYEESVYGNEMSQTQINVSHLNSGLYYVKVSSAQNTYSTKFIKR